jgi:hypothetical protein
MLSLEHTPTSQLFQAVLNNAPNDHVTLPWIIRRLRKRSFGMIMLLLGLIAMVPGISVIAALPLTQQWDDDRLRVRAYVLLPPIRQDTPLDEDALTSVRFRAAPNLDDVGCIA